MGIYEAQKTTAIDTIKRWIPYAASAHNCQQQPFRLRLCSSGFCYGKAMIYPKGRVVSSGFLNSLELNGTPAIQVDVIQAALKLPRDYNEALS